MKIAMVQVASADTELPIDRLARVEAMVGAISEDVELIVLPELWRVGYNHFELYGEESETLSGPTLLTFRQSARERGCFIHVGSFVQRDSRGELRNTAALVDADGRVAHLYDKMHVFGYHSAEAQLLAPGDTATISDTPFGNVASTTCYDLRFPALWAKLTAAGAEMVIVPAAWPAARREHFQLLTTARAVDNQCFVVACNGVGSHGGVELGGHSRVVDPWGRVVVEADDREGVTLTVIDPDLVATTRAEFPVLADQLDDYSTLNIGRNPE